MIIASVLTGCLLQARCCSQMPDLKASPGGCLGKALLLSYQHESCALNFMLSATACLLQACMLTSRL